MTKASVYEQTIIIPTYRAGAPEKDPLFLEKRAYQGSSGKVYPVPVCERISGEKEDVPYKAVILENDWLYVMILPELGGRIQRALDKTNGYDFVYYNRVIKPALVGLAGPWISGGIEFNWPQHHRPSTFMPVNYEFSEHPDGSASVTLGETDRMNGTRGNARITLYPDKAYIEIRGQLFNPTDYPQTFLWWANPAVSVNNDTFSVFPPDVNAVMDHGKRAVSTFPIATGEYYKADYSAGVDISRYKNIRVPTSYMAAHSDFDFVGNFDEGKDAGLLHMADHHVSPGKKQWTWGCGHFGKTWDLNLTDEDGPYIELMTGVFCDNQPDFSWLRPREEKNFVQYFMPYKTVGRVNNATRDVILGVDYMDENGKVLEASPFAFGRAANEALADRAASGRIKVYATGPFEQAEITVWAGEREIYRKRTDLSPEKAFTDLVPGLRDYRIEVRDSAGKTLCAYREYVRENMPVPEPAEAMKAPGDLSSAEELYLAGLHLEQYRHATRSPADYYLEGLRRDPSDIRLNNAYGLLLLRSGQAEESEAYFRAAVRKQTRRNPNPYTGEPYFNLGLALEAQEKLPDAFDAFYKATWNGETAGPAWYHLACIAFRQGQLREALEYVDESLVKGWHDMASRTLKAAILHRTASQDEEAFLEESAAIDPLCFGIRMFQETPEELEKSLGDGPENLLNLAYELIGFGGMQEAAELLSLRPATHPMEAYARAYALNRLGEKENAAAAAEQAEKMPTDLCFPNRNIEKKILEEAAMLLPEAPKAHYYLGELLYDKKQYEKAIRCWELAVREDPELAPGHRTLSIAYYNHGCRERAEGEIAEACRLEPENSRFLLEQEQLLSRLDRPVKERLALLEAHRELLEDRYALMLAYIRLLNADGQYEKALELLTTYTFHVWEGGEGKVADEYKTALFALAEKALDEGRAEDAFRYSKQTITYPPNLGEGKLDQVPDHRAYYMMGLACRKRGQEKEAADYFRRAAEGPSVPESVRYYNDQPSDYIYWQGLAFRELGDEEKALKCFHQLIIFGERHLHDHVDYDYFAVSLPELESYADDIQKRSDDYCRRLTELGWKGILRFPPY